MLKYFVKIYEPTHSTPRPNSFSLENTTT